MLLDTSFLIDLMRNQPNAVLKLEELENNDGDLIVPSPVLFELYVGIGKSKIPLIEKDKITQVLQKLETIPFTQDAAKHAGMSLGELYRKGNPVDPIDAQIAGIAYIHNFPLITNNAKHFERFTGIKIVEY